MAKYSIFSYTPNKRSNNSAELHRTDVDGNEIVLTRKQLELMESGHKIVDTLKQKDDRNGRNRRGRR